MSKAKLEKDFEEFNQQIDKLADEELKRIREKADQLRAEATRAGESIEASIEGEKD